MMSRLGFQQSRHHLWCSPLLQPRRASLALARQPPLLQASQGLVLQRRQHPTSLAQALLHLRPTNPAVVLHRHLQNQAVLHQLLPANPTARYHQHLQGLKGQARQSQLLQLVAPVLLAGVLVVLEAVAGLQVAALVGEVLAAGVEDQVVVAVQQLLAEEGAAEEALRNRRQCRRHQLLL